MFNEKDILTRLQNGENVEDIAQEVINLVNKANTTYEEQQKATEEQHRKDATAQKKKDKMKDILSAIEDYFKTIYPNVEAKNLTISDEDVEKAIKLMDEVAELADAVNELESMVQKKHSCLDPKKKTNSDKILADFLNDMGW